MFALLIVLLAQSPAPRLLPGEHPEAQERVASEPRRGSYVAKFERLHKQGERRHVLERLGFSRKLVAKEDPTNGILKLERHDFRVLVPLSYDPAKPAGLVVWMDPTDAGLLPAEWIPVLEQRNLIAVTPGRAGNSRYAWNRAALALVAVRALTEGYAIDAKRVYAAGFSGGGRMASRLSLAWPDVFTGGLAVGGAAFYESLADPGRPGHRWPARLKQPPARLLRMARKSSRYVLLVGSEDKSQRLCRSLAMHMAQSAGFLHVTYLEQPREGHELPSSTWLRRAVDALDAPLGLQWDPESKD